MTKTADHTPVSHISRMADWYVTNLDLGKLNTPHSKETTLLQSSIVWIPDFQVKYNCGGLAY